MKHLLVAALITLLASFLALAQQEKVSRISVFVPDRSTLDRVWECGVDYEGSSGKIGGWMEFVAGPSELKHLAARGIPYRVVIDDLSAYYAGRLAPSPMNALGFGYGSMGGFYTYAEVAQQLDSMRLLYPTLITAKASIGTSIEGRSIWAVKISDNPEATEPGEPEVLYTGLHHAREPEGMMSLLYYMWWLLQNYNTNPEAAYLVNNRQMWFIPVVNVDGYVYNQTTNPSGGGMWRKNRRNNGDGSFGIDLNRNYGPFFMWNAPNGGSSTNPSDDTYRGTAPWSEPEISAIDVFMRAHHFKTCLNYHTYGNYLVQAWGYLSRESGDSLLFRDWAYDMTFANHYTNGTDQQTVGYSTRGNSDDYMYGDTTKPITYAMTPEVGTTGFWPTSGEILPLAQENLPQNKFLAYFAGHYPTITGYQFNDAGGNGFIDRGENFALALTVKNRGLDTADNLSISLTSSASSVQFTGPSTTLPALLPQTSTVLSFPGFVTGTATTGVPFQVYVLFSDPSGFQKRDTLSLFIGTPTTLFADSAGSGTGNWNTGQGWGTTTNAHTPPYAFTDSPVGDYAANANNALTILNAINLTGYQYAELKFWTKWATEPTWDFATVEVSSNNGSTWSTMRSRLSHMGSARSGSAQPAGAWGYESYTPGLTWVAQQMDLSGYVNKQIKLRFRMAADGAEQRDGFTVDDITVLGYVTNLDTTPPARPTLASPLNGATGQARRRSLFWHTASGATSYHLQLASDSGFVGLVLDDTTLTDTSRSIGPLDYGTTYYWHVHSKNGAGVSAFSDVWSFTTIPSPPPAPLLAGPPNGATGQPVSLSLSWHPATTASAYQLQVASDTAFSMIVVNDSALADTLRQVLGSLLNNQKYFWRVRAINSGGLGPYSEIWQFRTVRIPPPAPVLLSPASGASGLPTSLVFRWRAAADADFYRLQLSFDTLFSSVVLDDSTIADTLAPVNSLVAESTYAWRVSARNVSGTGPWSSVWKFTVVRWFPTITQNVSEGWNLLSVPVKLLDYRKTVVYPTASSQAFFYSAGYTPEDTLLAGAGFWLKFRSDTGLSVTGDQSITDTVNVSAGWNMVGSLSLSMPFSSVTPVGTSIQGGPYRYSSSYLLDDSLTPGMGYWVKVSAQGTLIFSSSADTRKTPSSGLSAARLREFNSLHFRDAKGSEQTLYFGTRPVDGCSLEYYELPPPPPAGVCDIRYGSGRVLELAPVGAVGEFPIMVSSVVYPVTVRWDLRQEGGNPELILGHREISMTDGGSLLVPSIDEGLKLRLSGNLAGRPADFVLEQNYPNPFNPTTVVRYGLPMDALVSVRVFDVLGKQVAILADGVQSAGYKAAEWNAAALSSGIYYCRLEAVGLADPGRTFRDVRKLLLAK
jgi:carboxypeptidase T